MANENWHCHLFGDRPEPCAKPGCAERQQEWIYKAGDTRDTAIYVRIRDLGRSVTSSLIRYPREPL